MTGDLTGLSILGAGGGVCGGVCEDVFTRYSPDPPPDCSLLIFPCRLA